MEREIKRHKTEWTKVNAPVDKGVKGIVSVLSNFDYLETVESCEGDNISGPWVCFRYGSYRKNSWHELADFVLGYFSPRLIGAVGDDVSIKIQVTSSGNISSLQHFCHCIHLAMCLEH